MRQLSVAVSKAVFELPFEDRTICMISFTVAVGFIKLPFASVATSVNKIQGSIAVALRAKPFTSVLRTIGHDDLRLADDFSSDLKGISIRNKIHCRDL